MITETLQLIKQHTGLDLNLCDYFTGIHTSAKGQYFNIVLSDPIYQSREHTQLERFSQQYGLIQVEPNGYKRLAIFPLNHKQGGEIFKTINDVQKSLGFEVDEHGLTESDYYTGLTREG